MPGEKIRMVVPGLPPYKDAHFSIRNPKHRRYQRFVDLRNAAIAAMAGRAWYVGPVRFTLNIATSEMEHSLGDYAGGVADTLDGSHGLIFTYLPIVYQDDSQIVQMSVSHELSADPSYELVIDFLDTEAS
jgi:hypothetical protein